MRQLSSLVSGINDLDENGETKLVIAARLADLGQCADLVSKGRFQKKLKVIMKHSLRIIKTQHIFGQKIKRVEKDF